jgi:hypothetical protein
MSVKLKGQLPLSKKLSSTAQSAFVLDDLKTGTLISLAQLCDDDCTAIFNKYDVKILKNDEIIINGTRMPNGLWSLPISDPSPPQAYIPPLKTPPHQANGMLNL